MSYARPFAQRFVGGVVAAAVAVSVIGTPTTAQTPTTTTLVSSPNPSVFGELVSLVAVVVDGPAAVTEGTVTFIDEVGMFGTVLGTVSVDTGGTATLTITDLTVGSHTITARYTGTANFDPSDSNTLTHTVNPASTTTTLSSSPNPSVFGQAVTFTATVAPQMGAPPATPTGTVTFVDQTSGTVLGTVSVASAQASLVTNALTVGSHTIQVSYSGDGNFLPSASNQVVQVVDQVATETTLTSSPNPSTIGETVTFTATVFTDGVAADGSVTFLDGATTVGTVSVDSAGVATLQINSLAAGDHTITATYNGTATLAPSSTQLVHEVEGPVPTVPSSTSTTTTSTTTTTPTMTTSTTTTSSSPPPSSTTSTTSTSSTIPVQTETVTALTSSANPSVVGQAVTFTATVSPVGGGSGFAPTGFRAAAAPRQVDGGGTLTITDGGTVLGTVLLVAGQASFTTSSLTAGSHTITASFNGTAALSPSSATIVQQVNPAGTLPPTR